MRITKQLQEAINSYLNNRATAEEQHLVNEWYRSFNDDTVEVPADSELVKDAIEQRIKKRLDQTISASAISDELPVMHPVRSGRRKILVAAAAVITAVGTGLLWLLLQQDKQPAIPMVVIHTSLGEVKEMVLPDSSRVWLNAMSTIRYPQQFAGKNREVSLEGEAFFDISKDEQRQFVVHAGKTSTAVLGTAFNIAAYEPDMDIIVSVMRGKVQVVDAAVTSGILTPGHQIHYKPATKEMRQETTAITDKASWIEGKLVFDEMPMEQITAALSRWYNVTFEFDNAQLKYCRYTATFYKTMSLPELLDLFSHINNITYKINQNGTKVMLYGKGCQ
jgi:transmembrane sensor